ncbi:MAG: 2,3-bisphosphoglycerate-independent phosphoglycerate mutase [Clostridia bacterium]|nr:2,3-bisphosphoglycerate-independent phosphoglycerate mutase [Clostridia bacterium]
MVTLIILDGFGHREETKGNAIKLAGTPFLDKLKARYPNMLLQASGSAVGLSENQMGNSEVGHLTIGSGRILLQDLEKINNEIENGEFFKNKELNKSMQFVKYTGGAVHLIGLLSNGGVHSHINHLKALIDLAQKNCVDKVYIHAITDGRDTLFNSGLDFLNEIEDYCKDKNAEVASICGRFYAMDREQRFELTMKAYDMLALGKSDHYFQNAKDAIQASYSRKIYDEFIEPSIIGKPKTINSGDSVVFFNFRSDRARQLTQAISEPTYSNFPVKKLNNVYIVTMSEYSEDLKNVSSAYLPEKTKNTLSEIISQNDKKQFHIAETTKYAHVTFFFNGGKETPFKNEDRNLIPTLADTDYTKNPKMKAIEITETTMNAIADLKYDFILVNFSNADMLGHTANIEATKEAITCVDKCAYALAMATLMVGGDCLITADHGNAEMLLDENNNPHTSHTTSLVPFILITPDEKKFKLQKTGGLSNIASTVLKLLDIPKPFEMDNSLILD